MYGRHQAAFDAPFVVQHLGDGSQAVGGTTGVGNDGLTRVAAVVHAVNEHGRVVFAGGGENDFFRTSRQVFFTCFFGQEQARGFDHHICADLIPFQFSRVFHGRQTDGVAIDDQVVAFDAYLTLEATMHAVVLEHIGQIVWL